MSKEQILEKHLKTMLKRINNSYDEISEMRDTPEWDVTLNAMEEYAEEQVRQALDLATVSKCETWLCMDAGKNLKRCDKQCIFCGGV